MPRLTHTEHMKDEEGHGGTKEEFIFSHPRRQTPTYRTAQLGRGNLASRENAFVKRQNCFWIHYSLRFFSPTCRMGTNANAPHRTVPGRGNIFPRGRTCGPNFFSGGQPSATSNLEKWFREGSFLFHLRVKFIINSSCTFANLLWAGC